MQNGILNLEWHKYCEAALIKCGVIQSSQWPLKGEIYSRREQIDKSSAPQSQPHFSIVLLHAFPFTQIFIYISYFLTQRLIM